MLLLKNVVTEIQPKYLDRLDATLFYVHKLHGKAIRSPIAVLKQMQTQHGLEESKKCLSLFLI